ncbi:hypothetical protein ACWEJ6_36725, partial [Nonomuraea sp. NPDC004702]
LPIWTATRLLRKWFGDTGLNLPTSRPPAARRPPPAARVIARDGALYAGHGRAPVPLLGGAGAVPMPGTGC